MNERDLMPLDAGEGHRTPTSGGDRLMLLLAVLALAAGLTIAIGNLIPPSDDEIAVASTAPSATSVPSRTPRPSPTPRPLGQILVTPADAPDTQPINYWSQEWIRALQDLTIRPAPGSDTTELGVLAAGELALTQASDGVNEAPGWVYITEGGSPGWVQVEADGERLAERFPTYPSSWARRYAEVQSGDAGFIARAGDGAIAASPNGIRWTLHDESVAIGGGLYGTVWGPAGWLSASPADGFRGPSDLFLWRSDDGQDWAPIGVMATARSNDGFGFNGLWGSDLGYLMLGYLQGRQSFWFSTNGIAWLEMPSTGFDENDAWLQVAATPLGFYVADANSLGQTSAHAVFTADGGTWREVTGGPVAAPGLLVAALADRLVALDRDPASDAARLWIASVGGDGLDWVKDSSSGSTFAGTVPAVLVSDTQQLVAIGWDRETEEVRAWSSPDGVAWAQLPLPPDGFGWIPHQALGTRAGIIVMGESNDDGIQTMQTWRLVGSQWRRGDLPEVLGISPFDESSCPEAPRDAVEFIVLDPGVAVHCFGATPITFPAYSVACDGCGGGGDASLSPSWLAHGDPRIYLSPIVTENADWLDIVLGPSLEPDPAWRGAWVEIVGHFDDPAADECRQRLDPDIEQWYAGRQQLIEDCRRRFVITEVTVVDGP